MKNKTFALTANCGTVAVTPAELDTARAFADRIVAVFDGASEEVRAAGLDWYAGKARGLAQSVAETCHISFAAAAAVIAVCSPRTKWERQEAFTARMVAHLRTTNGDVLGAPRACTFVGQVEKAWRVLNGELDAVSGPKVGPFFENICGNETVVTLDVWAIKALIGRDADENEVNRWAKGRRRLVLEGAYHMAAERLGVTVARAQAVVWECVRRGLVR